MQEDLSNQPAPNPQQPAEEVTNALNFYKKASNPVIAIFTMIFKAAAAISFLILGLLTSNDAIIMLVVILLGAIDFWYTKNISGRFLVGLRWWNILNPQTGEERWIFESKNERK
ncbi:MAG: DUF846 domain-containing protein [archaeon]|nr:DUF846 domain-containing protein [archaeon]